MLRQTRPDAPGTVHHVILRGMERGQMVAAREDRESFLARLGLSLADTAWLLGVSMSGIAKAVARAEQPYVH
jgi:hypothetical protein